MTVPSIRPRHRAVTYEGPACPRCRHPFEGDGLPTGATVCPRCRGAFEATAFAPAPLEPPRIALAGPGDVPCGIHEGNTATRDCGRCGIFLCPVCAVGEGDKVLCPTCFGRLVAEGHLGRTAFPDYGARASGAAALCFLFCVPGGLLLGPVALYYGIQGLRQPKESRSGVLGPVLAILLGAVALLWSGFTFASLLFWGLD